MIHFKFNYYLSRIYIFLFLITGINAALAQSDAQLIVDNLRTENRSIAQEYIDRLSVVDANRLQCALLINFNYIFDYDADLFNQENMEWLLDELRDSGLSWPSICTLPNQESQPHCLIFGNDLSPNQANLLKEVFEGLLNCSGNNLNCIKANNIYMNAEYTDTYLYVVARYFAAAGNREVSRSNCEGFKSWAEAIVKTHTGYFNLGWDVFSDFQLQSGARSLQKSLEGMQEIVGLNENALNDEYQYQLQNLADTDSAGAREKYRMFITTLTPYVEN